MNKDNLFLSISILLAGVLIAGAVIYSANQKTGLLANTDSLSNPEPREVKIAPVTSADHILGNINAQIKIVEFSDLQCPFCARFHPTLKRILDENKSEVAWVYRHFPLESIHPNARPAALASECAAEQNGNDGFWAYIDEVFVSQTEALSDLTAIARKIGLDTNKFDACVKSKKYESAVDEDIKDAENSGGRGTPWTVVINSDGETFPINGALPYDQVKAVIDRALGV
ncbi:MAG: thioredoxin domain-containing protein [Candidatus Liptonbacteria bacterium]|nr:thioredoxin domain-containing protein [Candidatus Liptonbacteria bacterium]